MRKLSLGILGLSILLSACNQPQLPARAHTILISAGGNHTCALSADGGVSCWGSNEKGQLGDGTWLDRPTPVAVSSLGKDIIAVTAGHQHACALSSKGIVSCWGSNEKGQLGDGTWMDRPTPVAVSGLPDNIIAIAAGGEHTCALNAGGAVKCWGANESGQLGNDARDNRFTPVSVSGLANGVTAIVAGNAHTCALVGNGAVKCWGANNSGQLGNKSKKDSQVPVNVSGLGDGIAAIAAGGEYSCALTDGGGVQCWGWNGNEIENHVAVKPENIKGLEKGVASLAAGGEHTCALTENHRVACWGSNYVGQLGNEAMQGSSVPVSVNGLGSDIVAIAAGSFHTCVLSESVGVECWGQNYQGELGGGDLTRSATPVRVTGLKAATFVSMTATAAPTHTPAPTPTSVPPTLIPWPTPTAIPTLQAGQALTMIWLHMLDGNLGWGIDATGHILHTADGGFTWRLASPPEGTYDEHGFFAADSNNAWAASLPILPDSKGCDWAASCHIGATIWHTTDGGITWQPSKSWQATRALPRPDNADGEGGPYNDAPHALFFVDPATGWLLLEDWALKTNIISVLARTTDGGESLREIWRADGIGRFTGVAFVNRQIGYLGQDNTTFFDVLDGLPLAKDYIAGRQAPYLQKTNDGGKTWEVAWLPGLSPIPAALQALENSSERMLCGVKKLQAIAPQGMAAEVACRVTSGYGPFYFYYLSSDGGAHWHSWIPSGNESFRDPVMGWRLYTAGPGQPGQFQATANGGLDWVTLKVLPWQDARFDFLNDRDGWAIVTKGSLTSLARTMDGGHSWMEIQPLAVNP